MSQDVLADLVVWSRKETTGKEAQDLMAGARVIAKRAAQNYWRKVRVEGKYTAGLSVLHEEHAARDNGSTVDLIDLKRAFEDINKLVASGQISAKGAATIVALAEETTLQEHANETDQNSATVRKILERTRAVIQASMDAERRRDIGLRWKTGAAVASVAAILLLVFFGRLNSFRNGPVAHNPKSSPTSPEMPPPAPPTLEALAEALAPPKDDHDEVDRQLLRAEVDYKNYAWDDCVRLVDSATKLDPLRGAASELRNACENEKQRGMDAKFPRRPRH